MKFCMYCIFVILCLFFILLIYNICLFFFVLDINKYLKGYLIKLLVGFGLDIFCIVFLKVRLWIFLSFLMIG